MAKRSLLMQTSEYIKRDLYRHLPEECFIKERIAKTEVTAVRRIFRKDEDNLLTQQTEIPSIRKCV